MANIVAAGQTEDTGCAIRQVLRHRSSQVHRVVHARVISARGQIPRDLLREKLRNGNGFALFGERKIA